MSDPKNAAVATPPKPKRKRKATEFVVQRQHVVSESANDIEGEVAWIDAAEKDGPLTFADASVAAKWLNANAEDGEKYRIIAIKSGILTAKTETVTKVKLV